MSAIFSNIGNNSKPLIGLSLAGIVLAILLLIATHETGLRYMVQIWDTLEEYSYGYLIPFITLYLVWEKRHLLLGQTPKHTYAGVVLLIFSLSLCLIGSLSAVRLLIQYGFVLGIFAVAICVVGTNGFRLIMIPMLILLFMIPLPQFLLKSISSDLQLLSSQIGVQIIRLFDISVHLEGNVIDLGAMKLQVVDACSGLRYLFPLMALAVIATYLFKDKAWKKWLVLFSAIPITVLVNSVRIGLIGITVEYWGEEMAKGLLHDFEGWFMFMICMALLLVEMAILAKIDNPQVHFFDVFGLDGAAASNANLNSGNGIKNIKPLMIALVLLLVFWGFQLVQGGQDEIKPKRKPFLEFPLLLNNDWLGHPDQLDRETLNALAVTDYALINFTRNNEMPVNFYVAYYESQSNGQSSHSPKTCLPGGGWELSDIKPIEINGAASIGKISVNRTIIHHGEARQLVYYWFQQRGHAMTNEVLVKWAILRDAMSMHRTDGAMVRLITTLKPGEDPKEGDLRLQNFFNEAGPLLGDFIPGETIN
ncbi:VPLPA-CTERM-specific exosortase XrtD [Ampullimonas aquatilis]|uniref:VPLPA-CTERM-specific exosortase XrtD n=1 Tax=Ampullimonas aquatilis TaxID=1341549 RepID=UPI003C706F9D